MNRLSYHSILWIPAFCAPVVAVSIPLLSAKAANEILEGYELLVEGQDKLQVTKSAFFKIFAQDSINTVKLHRLMREADKQGKASILAGLIKLHDLEPSPGIRQACFLSITAFPEAAGQSFGAASAPIIVAGPDSRRPDREKTRDLQRPR